MPTDADIKARGVIHLPIIEAERLFIDVTEQVERLHADVSSVQLPLNERPEIFHAVSMHIAIRVLNCVIDDLMFEAIFQTIVGPQFIGEDRRARLDVLVDVALKFLLAAIVYDHCANVSTTLQHAHDNGLILAASASDDQRTLALMHVAGFAANESFVNLDSVTTSAKLASVFALLGESNPVQHEPRGFLSNIERTGDLTATHTILAIQNEPHCGKPLIQTQRAILENRSDLHGELPLWVPVAALPPQLVLKETNLGTAALGTNNTVLPLWTAKRKVLQAVRWFREVEDRFLQALWFIEGFHSSSLLQNNVLVKYISALIWINKDSTLRRSWHTINDAGCPIQLVKAGARIERRIGTLNLEYKPIVESFVAKEPIAAMEMRFAL